MIDRKLLQFPHLVENSHLKYLLRIDPQFFVFVGTFLMKSFEKCPSIFCKTCKKGEPNFFNTEKLAHFYGQSREKELFSRHIVAEFSTFKRFSMFRFSSFIAGKKNQFFQQKKSLKIDKYSQIFSLSSIDLDYSV